MADHQTEKAFQQQEGVFLNKRKIQVEGKKTVNKTPRYYKKIGLGYTFCFLSFSLLYSLVLFFLVILLLFFQWFISLFFWYFCFLFVFLFSYSVLYHYLLSIASRPLRLLSSVVTSIRSAPSLLRLASEAESSLVLSNLLRWKEPSSSVEITSTTSLNTTVMKSVTPTSLLTALLALTSRKVTELSLVNADLSPRLSVSMSSRLKVRSLLPRFSRNSKLCFL